MIRRIFKRVLIAIKEELEWFEIKRWLKSRATKYTVGAAPCGRPH